MTDLASIQKRGEYQWRTQVRRRGYPTQTKTFETYAEAEAWAAVIESEQARGVFTDRTESERTTLGELIERYRTEITPHKKTAEDENYRLNKLQALRSDRATWPPYDQPTLANCAITG